MPVLILTITEDLHELFQDGRLTAITALGKLGGIVVVTVYATLVLVVAVGRAEDGGAYGAGEMLDMVFAVESCNIRASEGLSAFEAEKVEPSEVVGFAQGVLPWGLFGHGEEFGRYNFPAVLQFVSTNIREGGGDRRAASGGLEHNTSQKISRNDRLYTYVTGEALEVVSIAKCSHELSG